MAFRKVKRLSKHYYRMLKLALTRILFPKRKMVFLFGAPYHPNMGDQAQTYCIQQWYLKNFPKHEVIIFLSSEVSEFTLWTIKRFIRKGDVIVCHSGYHLTDMYNVQEVYFKVIKLFKEYPIVIFPQTINYSSKEVLQEAKDVLNSHPKLTILCRDEQSYEIAQRHFDKVHVLLYPDIVTSLIGTRYYEKRRDGVLFCMRDDVEAFYKPEQIKQLIYRFDEFNTGLTDTTRIDIPMNYILNHRDIALNQVWDEFSQYKLVITDRYHGTIFSLITGTPVIVLRTSDHKLKSGVKWFPKEIFGDYVFFANDLNEAYELAMSVLNHYDKIDHKLPAYFKEKYYDVLKEKLY